MMMKRLLFLLLITVSCWGAFTITEESYTTNMTICTGSLINLFKTDYTITGANRGTLTFYISDATTPWYMLTSVTYIAGVTNRFCHDAISDTETVRVQFVESVITNRPMRRFLLN